MTDATLTGAADVHHTEAAAARRRRRHAADRRLRLYGLVAISLALGMLGILVASLMVTGAPALTQTHVEVDFPIAEANVDAENLADSNWRAIVQAGVEDLLADIDVPAEPRQLSQILTNNTQFEVRNAVLRNPEVVGGILTLDVPASDPYDQLAKGLVDRDTPEARRRVNDEQIAWFDALEEQGRVSRPLNWGLFTNADSRFPEIAGLAGAMVGSFYVLLVCFLVSLPVGIAAAIYLEEFAPKNRITDVIEVNINNLAAVPSIIFGLLGLAVFIQIFGLPRSVPLVGGLVLALMTLPTIIIVTRNALKAVPPSIREAAFGVGASRHQVVLHHVLPLALPGIMTGTIIGMAQALGETAPLLLIGMNAFITSPPGGILDPSTTLPTQVFIWADSPERGFVSRTSAGILVLLMFLITMNALAIFLRQRFERTW
jgi:phosphate transport system permease protein